MRKPRDNKFCKLSIHYDEDGPYGITADMLPHVEHAFEKRGSLRELKMARAWLDKVIAYAKHMKR